MSLQAIAGIAYDRRYPASPTQIGARQMLEAGEDTAVGDRAAKPRGPHQVAAKQINGALESLKRYIPTEFLALYLPFLAIVKDRSTDAAELSNRLYVGFLIATPLMVFLIYIAKAVEVGKAEAYKRLPWPEALLATAAFAVWGATVPGMFEGHQWWLAMLAMASAVVLPLIDAALGHLARVDQANHGIKDQE